MAILRLTCGWLVWFIYCPCIDACWLTLCLLHLATVDIELYEIAGCVSQKLVGLFQHLGTMLIPVLLRESNFDRRSWLPSQNRLHAY